MSIKKKEIDNVVYYDVYVSVSSNISDARKQKKVSNITSLAKAKTIHKKLLEECTREVDSYDDTGIPWKELCTQYLSYKSNDKLNPTQHGTLKEYQSALKKWTKPLLNKRAVDIVEEDIKNILVRMDKLSMSNASKLKVKNLIGRIFKWGKGHSKIPVDTNIPTTNIKIVSKNERTPTFHSSAESKILLESAKELNHAWYSVWFFALYTGMRNGELIALKWEDINLNYKTIRVCRSYNRDSKKYKTTKSGNWRDVPINEKLMELILELKKDAKNSYVLPRHKAWFNGLQAKILRAFCKEAKISQIRFHDLRAGFATAMLQEGVPPIKVQRIGGWSDIKTMGIYIRQSSIEVAGATDVLKF